MKTKKRRGLLSFAIPQKNLLKLAERLIRDLAEFQSPAGMARYARMTDAQREDYKARLLDRVDGLIAECAQVENGGPALQRSLAELEKVRENLRLAAVR